MTMSNEDLAEILIKLEKLREEVRANQKDVDGLKFSNTRLFDRVEALESLPSDIHRLDATQVDQGVRIEKLEKEHIEDAVRIGDTAERLDDVILEQRGRDAIAQDSFTGLVARVGKLEAETRERVEKLEKGAQLNGTIGRTAARAYTEFGTLEYPEDIARARGLVDKLSDSTSITEPGRELLRKIVAFAEQMLGGFVAEHEK